MRHGRILLVLIASAGLAACGEPTQLYIAHNTVIGLDAAVDTNRQSGRLLFGYDRQFIAPKSVPDRPVQGPDAVREPAPAPKPDRPVQGSAAAPERDECAEPGANCREAMAALSCNEVEVRGIFLTRFKDNLATGTAATKAARTIKEAAEGKGSKQERSAIPVLFDCWKIR
jgi:hypothetical protein